MGIRDIPKYPKAPVTNWLRNKCLLKKQQKPLFLLRIYDQIKVGQKMKCNK